MAMIHNIKWFVSGPFAMSFVLGCGIEVGNPSGKKGGTSGGKLSIYLADSPSPSIGRTFFNLLGVSTVAQDSEGNPGEPTPLTGAYSGKLDGAELDSGKTFALTREIEITAGDYEGISLDLNQDVPILIRDSKGVERPVPFANKEAGLYVSQIFSVKEDETLDLTLHLDLRRSVKRKGESFEFGPIAHMIRKEDESSISGKVDNQAITVICAYLKRGSDFNGGDLSRLPRDRRPQKGSMLKGNEDRSRGVGPKGRFKARIPESNDPNAQNIEYDQTSDCSGAFATTETINGEFKFSHLWPGNYTLRFYGADGVLLGDPIIRTEVAPGEAKILP